MSKIKVTITDPNGDTSIEYADLVISADDSDPLNQRALLIAGQTSPFTTKSNLFIAICAYRKIKVDKKVNVPKALQLLGGKSSPIDPVVFIYHGKMFTEPFLFVEYLNKLDSE